MEIWKWLSGEYSYRKVAWKKFPKWVRRRIKHHRTYARSPPYPCIVKLKFKGKHRKYKYCYTVHQFPSQEWCYIRKRHR